MAGNILFSSYRKHLIGTGAAMAGWIATIYVPNTWGIKIAKLYIHNCASYCKSITADPETEALLDEVISDINGSRAQPVRKDRIEFLQTNELNPHPLVHKGHSFTGAFIGLPIGTRSNAEDVFHYHCPDQFDEQMSSFCLFSKAAKKFIIARQIVYVEDNYMAFRCLLGLGFITVGSYVHYLINSSLDMLKGVKYLKSRQTESLDAAEDLLKYLRFTAKRHRFYTCLLVSLALLPVYRFMVNTYNWTLEESADESVANLGSEYVHGGQEYYEKVLDNNMFVSKFEDGEKSAFTADGNIEQGRFVFLFKHVPHRQRYQYFNSLTTENGSHS